MESRAADNFLPAVQLRLRTPREQARRSMVQNLPRRLPGDRDARASMRHSIQARAILWQADEGDRTTPLPEFHRRRFGWTAVGAAPAACSPPHLANSLTAAEPDVRSA